MPIKYTKELLESAVRDSISIREVLKILALQETGANYLAIKKRFQQFEIDTSHFLGRRANSGARHESGNRKLEWIQVLVLDRRKGCREKIEILRKALLASGVPEICENCKCPPIWNGLPLTLHVDHRNGNCLDNRPGNPRFLCPNCHSQTGTYGSRNIKLSTNPYKVWNAGIQGFEIKKERPKPKPSTQSLPCAKCGVIVEKPVRLLKRSKNVFCGISCKNSFAYKVKWPSDDDLRRFVFEESRLRVAAALGVSEMAVRKRCKKLGIPMPDHRHKNV